VGSDDQEDEETGEEAGTSGWIPRVVYEPLAFSGDLPGPGEVLRGNPELASDPQWAVYLVG